MAPKVSLLESDIFILILYIARNASRWPSRRTWWFMGMFIPVQDMYLRFCPIPRPHESLNPSSYLTYKPSYTLSMKYRLYERRVWSATEVWTSVVTPVHTKEFLRLLCSSSVHHLLGLEIRSENRLNVAIKLLLIGVNCLMPEWKRENNCINWFVVYRAHWLAVTLCIRDMLGSNLGRNTGYHGWRSSWFSSVSTDKCRDNTSIRTWPLPVTAFPIQQPF
jgi:hypothetical protein